MKKILFVYDIANEALWKDGLWAAIQVLKKDFEIIPWNLRHSAENKDLSDIDFALGWGGFGSPVDRLLSDLPLKKGLCLGGYAPLKQNVSYSVIFYETEWSKKWLEKFCDVPMIHAFGINSDMYWEMGEDECPLIWDYLTVGAFAKWKRQERILIKEGHKMAVGEIQKENLTESIDIIGNLLLGGCGVSDMVTPDRLRAMYNASKKVYIPADLMGGGERAVLEARSCGKPVEIEADNPKLAELLTSPVWDHHYYAAQLKKGIEQCI